MILSFNPVIVADENIICAGRAPGPEELAALGRAQAIILPQGVREDLYRLCRGVCPLVWPDYDLRFSWPGKVGQALLFGRYGVSRPATMVYPSVGDFLRLSRLEKPYVLKNNLGGQGSGVFLVETGEQLAEALGFLEQAERMGRGGFIQQELVDHGGRDLRVVVIGGETIAYWRWAGEGSGILTNLAAGGREDFDSDPDLIERGKRAVRDFCDRTGINLAAFDVMFRVGDRDCAPLFIEINYFFGRQALGGSFEFYKLLERAAHNWLKEKSVTE